MLRLFRAIARPGLALLLALLVLAPAVGLPSPAAAKAVTPTATAFLDATSVSAPTQMTGAPTGTGDSTQRSTTAPFEAAAPPTVGGTPVFPATNIWNRRVADLPLHPNSANYMASILSSIGANNELRNDFGANTPDIPVFGIPYVVVAGSQPKVTINYTDYGDESDPGPFPIPPNAPIEGGPSSDGDRHVIVVDKDNGDLFELFYAWPQPNGSWNAASGARWSLNSNALRPERWTSADAAGLPIFPGLARYEEVAAGAINHALRFTAPKTQRAHLWPARHDAGSTNDANAPPMGLRLRLKAGIDISSYPPQARIILQGLKDYGMMLSDNSGSPRVFVSGAPDDRWNNNDLATMRRIKISDFEAVDVAGLMIDPNSAEARGAVTCDGPDNGQAWYFAEGYTGPGFDEYLTIQNPTGTPAPVCISYYLTGRPPVYRQIEVPGNSRYTVAVHGTTDGVGRDQAVAARVQSTNGVGIIVERPIYFRYSGRSGTLTGGHNVMGARAPQTAWYFAEGYTGEGFDQYLTIMNPNPTPATTMLTYFLDGGAGPIVKSLVVPANSRETVIVHESERGVGPGQAVSARVTSDQPIVVERPMYFRYAGRMGVVDDGHNVMGAAAPRTAWFFADGATTTNVDEYLTIMNPNPAVAPITLTYWVDGDLITRNLAVPANSRFTVAVWSTDLGVGVDKTLSVKVETSLTGGIVVERPVYFRTTLSPGSGSTVIDGGSNVMGAAAAGTDWYFAEGYTGSGFDEYLTILNPQPVATGAATVRITYLLGTGPPQTREISIPAQTRRQLLVNDVAEGVGPGQAVSARVTSLNSVAIVAERTIFFAYSGAGGTGPLTGGHVVLGYSP